MMDFVRVHRYPFDGRIRGGLAIFLVLNLFTCCFSVYSTGLRTFTSAIEVLSIETMPFWGIVSFIEYVQSFIATVLIALLLSYQPLSGTRQVAFVGWFVVLQIGFALFNFSIAAAGVGLNGAGGVGSSLNIRNVFVWSVFLQPVFAILCRELVNLALWKAVQRRLEA